MQDLTWNEISDRINRNEILYRTPEMNIAYENHKNKLKEQKRSLASYVNEYLFSDERPYVLTLNNFPYQIEKGLYNYILWINPIDSLDFKFVQTKIKEIFGEALIMQNPEYNRSIKEITHYHIFTKNNIGNHEDYLDF